jgi:hypothetical protein
MQGWHKVRVQILSFDYVSALMFGEAHGSFELIQGNLGEVLQKI